MTQNTPKDIVLEVEKRFDREFTRAFNLISDKVDPTLGPDTQELVKAFMLREISAAEERENVAWLGGLRCDNCGAAKEYQATSSMCDKCWEEA